MSAKGAAATERIELLDGLRGFAVLGILLANILYWSGWIFMEEKQHLALAGRETVEAHRFLHALLIDGKFYTIFSLLFGIGFSLQLDRLDRRGADGVRIYLRRVLVLLCFGLIHVTLIWDGDILTLYALLGLLLPLFRKWSDRALAIAALTLLLLPLAGAPLFKALGWAPHQYFYDLAPRLAERLGGTPRDLIAWLRREDIQGYASWVLSGWPYAIGTRLEGWRIPKVLGIMLLGMLLGRRLAAPGLLEDRRLLWWTVVAGLLIGLPFSYFYARDAALHQDSAAAVIGTAPLAFAYAAAFALAWARARAFLRWFVPVGRMALTNYLTHSLLGIVIFYGIGFGLVGTVTPFQVYGIAAAIFAAQAAFSRWWLARCQQGPVEQLWRFATYGRSPLGPASREAPRRTR